MTAEQQRAYVQRQKAADPEGWASRQRASRQRRKARDPEGWARKRAEESLSRNPDRHAVEKAADPEGWTQRARASRAAWAEANPEKVRAHWRVNNALRSGRLVRLANCERCAAPCKPQASHEDYDRPLEVEWLCQPCHKRKDSRFQLEGGK